MPVYRTEVSFDGPIITGPTLTAAEFGTRPSVYISAYDDSSVWALEARQAFHSYGSSPVIFEYRSEFHAYFNVTFNGDPALGTFVSGGSSIVQANGNNGAAIAAGFTMAIEKDEAADQLRFVTPLGTLTKTLSSFGSLDASPLRMDSMAHQFVRSNTGADGSSQWDWFNFYSKNAGTNFRGAALSSAAPGAWSGWTDVMFGFPVGAIANSANSQEATRYRTRMTYVAADGTRSGGSRQWRNWVGGDTVDTVSAAAFLDMTRAREHGAIWATYAYNASIDTLQWRRTFDKGGSAAEGAIYSAASTSNTSPSINWFYGRLFAVWHNGSAILQSVSHDMGTTWGTPVTLSGITGTNPRHVVDDHGLSLYFWIDGTDLKLKRSSDFGQSFLDATPITVASGVTAQSVDCEIAPDGSYFLAYISSGTWIQLRSRDLGKSWS
jgi:hypothetical protein